MHHLTLHPPGESAEKAAVAVVGSVLLFLFCHGALPIASGGELHIRPWRGKALLEEVEQHVAVAKRALLEARRVKSESLWS
jgi:hypothetical protein